ncbi:MAG: response regulator [Planctomycetia bacterium]|nr:response regulator [Planctomycetia bacterium]
MESKPTVYAVDNDHSTTTFIRNLAEKMNLECRTHSSGLEFLDTFDRGGHGCLILALRIADISGPQIQRRLINRGIPLPVIFVTAHATVPVIVRVMRDGALAVLEKPIVEQELWDAIQEAIRLDRRRQREKQCAEQLKTRFAAVTGKEHVVMDLLLEGNRNPEIAESLRLSIRTVELRRNRLMKKLQVRSLVELAQIAVATGNGFAAPANHSWCATCPRRSECMIDPAAGSFEPR